MITIRKYDKSDVKTWNDFIAKSKNGIFMFNRGFMEYHSDRFTDNSLMFYSGDELVAVLPASIRDNILYSHQGLTYGGFIVNSDMKQAKMLECFTALRQYMSEHNIHKTVYKRVPPIFHKMPSDEDLYALFLNNAKILKIEPSTAIYLANPAKMPKGRRAQIARARREGVAISESTDFNGFIDLENSVLNLRHNTTAVHTGPELALLHSRFPGNIKLFIARHQDRLIAATLLFIYENVVHTQYMAANEVGREIGGLDLLIKTLIDEYKDKKQYFDFGISSENMGRHLNTGLISQKEHFGGRTVAYTTWELER